MPPELPADSTFNQAARQILRSYPSHCQPRGLQFLNSGGGFSGARLWRVDAEGGLYALRAMPSATVNIERLKGLHRLLSHVHDRQPGTGVAVPVFTTEGATFIIGNEHVWQLESWLPGAADYLVRPSRVRLQNALRTLACWHVAARTFVPTVSEERWFASKLSARSPGLSERLGAIDRWTAEIREAASDRLKRRSWPEFDELGLRALELFPRVAPSVVQQLKIGSGLCVPLQPCLRDVWHDHVFYSGDCVTGFIDAHSCRTDCVATDLARLLGSLVLDDRDAWDDGLGAYGAIRPLSLDERGLVEVFDRSAVLLNGLTWLQWHCFEGRRFSNPEIVVDRLRTIVGRLDRLSRKTGM